MSIHCAILFYFLIIQKCDANESVFINTTLATESVQFDPDDPAIWINKKTPELSLLFGTDKIETVGALFVYYLNGTIKQIIQNLDRPNNVDVEYGFNKMDIVVLTERRKQQLRIYAIDDDKLQLYEVGGNTQVFEDRVGENAAPMGIGLYKRPSDGEIFAIVSSKTGPKTGYLGQYRLKWNEKSQKIDLEFVRYFGDFYENEIESIVVDDQLGYVYYSDEGYGIRKYNVCPDNPQKMQLGLINTTNIWLGDSEGLAIYDTGNNDGYLIITDQIETGSIFRIYERQSSNSYLKSIRTNAISTDGLDVTSHYLNAQFPNGMMIAMNKNGNNFLLFDWRNIAHIGDLRLNLNNTANTLYSFFTIITSFLLLINYYFSSLIS
ncbi:unnamed protein product [Didymodactylos carnosus]|uniref:BPP domain-containing protein n=1 Tax=Didymodactylos carnosus TaxID=1234261 RepID=A0A813YQE6_9BILA|nr:unnamed protein product [Didymodactylos carnosus]CAF1463311.1 unnamed protein product [Didymodactylos carnosus]CAF3672464.1 unnamed protein product [Didymodactylos carnosus]CAF4256168.1 unnamed protein product [Didymodactylos carnosus]